MSSSVNPISSAQLMDECSPANKQYTKVLWHKNKTLLVRRFIPFEEMLDLVHSVIDSVLQPDKELFVPEMADYATRAAIVSYYAAVSFPETVDAQYELLYTTDLYDVVCKSINQSQLASILNSIRLILSSIAGCK